MKKKEEENMKKRLLSMILVVIMVLSMAACGSSKETNETEVQESTETEIGVVKIGVDGTYPPFNYVNDDNELTGFEVEMLEEISKRTGIEIQIEPLAWDGIFGQLDAGKIDTIACCIFPNEERQEKYDFSSEYIYDENRVMVRKGEGSKYKTYEDLAGITFGCAGSGNNYERLAELQQEVDFEIVTYSEEREVYDLGLGRIDAVYESPVSAMAQAKEAGFEIEAAECPSLEKASCALPFRKDDERSAKIRETFSEAIKEMIEDGTMKELSEKWLGMDLSVYEPLFNF